MANEESEVPKGKPEGKQQQERKEQPSEPVHETRPPEGGGGKGVDETTRTQFSDSETHRHEVASEISGQLTEIKTLLRAMVELQQTGSEESNKVLKAMEQRYSSSFKDLVTTLDQLKVLSEKESEYFRRSIELQEAVTPEELRLPTPERVVEQKKIEKKDAKYTNERYQQYVDDWFEERLRYMESFEQSFEEQGDTYRYLVYAVSHFALRDETRLLGEKLRDKLEARRVRQRMVRIWNLADPGQILAESSRMSFTTMQELFANQEKNVFDARGNKTRVVDRSVEKEFQQYEKMGRILRERRDEKARIQEDLDDANKRGSEEQIDTLKEKLRLIKDEVDIKERFIQDYFKHGGVEGVNFQEIGRPIEVRDAQGRVKTEAAEYNRNQFVDQKIKDAEKRLIQLRIQGTQEGLSDQDKVRIGKEMASLTREKKDLSDKLWARKYSGGLWSISLRAAYHDVQINGIGDFYSCRILNFADRLAGNANLRKTRGIWNPNFGKYAGKPLDMGYRDLITGMLAKANERDLRGVGFRVDKDNPNNSDVVWDGGGVDDIKSLENLQLGSKGLWEDLLDEKLKTKEGEYGIRMDYFNKAEATRKVLMNPDGYFHDPGIEEYVRLTQVFEHSGIGGRPLGFTDKNGKEVIGRNGKPKTETVSGQEEKWIEILERTLEWMKKDPKAGEVVEMLKTSKISELYNWIEEASTEELISNERRDQYFENYVGSRSRSMARTKVSVDLFLGFYRNPELRSMTLTGWAGDALRRIFRFIFGEDVGVR